MFPSRQAVLDSYGSRPPFSSFHPTALQHYIDHGFADLPGAANVPRQCLSELPACSAAQTVFWKAQAKAAGTTIGIYLKNMPDICDCSHFVVLCKNGMGSLLNLVSHHPPHAQCKIM